MNRYQQKRYQKSISFLSFLFVFFLLSSNTVLSITQTEQKNISPVLKTGRTIYVDDDAALGGNGSIEHPFKYINEGIQNAVPGYTVYVFSGIYINEIVYIEKENITLIGENKETTILYVKDVGYDIIITANHVTVSGFTIRNYCMMAAARKILITSDFCTISDNILADEGVVICNHFIMLEGANYTIIKNNVFGKYIDLGPAVFLINSHYNSIQGNTFVRFNIGIVFFSSNYNTITNNKIGSFLMLQGSCYNNISRNYLSPVRASVNLGYGSNYNRITYNNFGKRELKYWKYELGPQVTFNGTGNFFDHNYWSRPLLLPKILHGYGESKYVITVDWHPAKEPYQIS